MKTYTLLGWARYWFVASGRSGWTIYHYVKTDCDGVYITMCGKRLSNHNNMLKKRVFFYSSYELGNQRKCKRCSDRLSRA